MNPSAAEIARSCKGARKTGYGWQARCPSHDDKVASLSIGERNGTVLFRCHAGCSQEALLEHFKQAGLWPESNGGKKTWTIKSSEGSVIATKYREDDPSGKKRCWWEPGGVKPAGMLYLAEQTRNGYDSSQPVYVCEGEKATDAAVRLGLQAVGTVGGASSCPSPEILSCLERYPVILWPDYDDPGQRHMADISAKLNRAVQIVDNEALWAGQAPAGQDAADLPALPAGGLPVKDMPFQGRRLIRMRASDVTAKRVDWFVDGYIPKGMASILAGDPGTGKSFLALDWCASASRAGDRSIYMVFEDAPEYTMVPRLDGLDADKAQVEFIAGMQDGEHETAFNSDHLDLVDDVLEQSGASLLVIDPIQAFTSSGVDIYRDNEVRAIMTPLGKLAAKHNCAVLIIMHLRKPMGSERRTKVSIHDVRNSGDYVGAARSVLGVAYKDKEVPEYGSDVRRVYHIKNNVGPQSPYFEFSIDNGGYHPLSVPRAGESGGGKVLNMPARSAGQYAEEMF